MQRAGAAGLPQTCGYLPDCASDRDVHRQRKRGTKRRHTAGQAANAALVAGSNAGFVCCPSLVVNSRLKRRSQSSPESSRPDPRCQSPVMLDSPLTRPGYQFSSHQAQLTPQGCIARTFNPQVYIDVAAYNKSCPRGREPEERRPNRTIWMFRGF